MIFSERENNYNSVKFCWKWNKNNLNFILVLGGIIILSSLGLKWTIKCVIMTFIIRCQELNTSYRFSLESCRRFILYSPLLNIRYFSFIIIISGNFFLFIYLFDFYTITHTLKYKTYFSVKILIFVFKITVLEILCDKPLRFYFINCFKHCILIWENAYIFLIYFGIL